MSDHTSFHKMHRTMLHFIRCLYFLGYFNGKVLVSLLIDLSVHHLNRPKSNHIHSGHQWFWRSYSCVLSIKKNYCTYLRHNISTSISVACFFILQEAYITNSKEHSIYYTTLRMQHYARKGGCFLRFAKTICWWHLPVASHSTNYGLQVHAHAAHSLYRRPSFHFPRLLPDGAHVSHNVELPHMPPLGSRVAPRYAILG